MPQFGCPIMKQQLHHCRKCGAVICANCSSKKFLLPSQSSKPLRVCDGCYAILTTTSGSLDAKMTDEKGNRSDSGTDDDSDDDENPEQSNNQPTDDDKPYFYAEK